MRACFANVFATKLVINTRGGMGTGEAKGGRERFPRGGSGARSEPRDPSFRAVNVERARVDAARLYREEKQRPFDAGQGRAGESR